jgi:predicted small secreted protein
MRTFRLRVFASLLPFLSRWVYAEVSSMMDEGRKNVLALMAILALVAFTAPQAGAQQNGGGGFGNDIQRGGNAPVGAAPELPVLPPTALPPVVAPAPAAAPATGQVQAPVHGKAAQKPAMPMKKPMPRKTTQGTSSKKPASRPTSKPGAGAPTKG